MATKKRSAANDLELAVEVFENLLELVPVVQQLAKAPKAAMEWAAKVKADSSASGRLASMTDRIGQKGLERRVAALRTGIELALPPDDATGRLQLLGQVDRLDQAVQVAAGLPLVKRKQAHSRIDHQLDLMERGLVEALLPKG